MAPQRRGKHALRRGVQQRRSPPVAGRAGDCLDHKRFADTLKKIGFEGDVCTMEVFRPDYYKLSNEENIKKAAEVTRAHVAKYWGE